MNKDCFINNGEDIYVHYKNGKETGLYIIKHRPYAINKHCKKHTTYSVRNLTHKFEEVKSFQKAKELATIYAQ